MNIIGENLEPIKEPTYQEVLDSLNMILDKGLHFAIIEEFEDIAEYILILEKLLDENKIAYDDKEIKQIKIDYEKELEKDKKWLLLHMIGKIIKKEGP